MVRKQLVYRSIGITIVVVFLLSHLLYQISLLNEEEFFVLNGKKLYGSLVTEYGAEVLESFPKYIQKDEKSCGVAVLSYLLGKHKIDISQKGIKNEINFKNLTSFYDMKQVLARRGFTVIGQKMKYNGLKLQLQAGWHLIVHLSYGHFILLKQIKDELIYAFDPAVGRVKIHRKTFLKIWSSFVLQVKK